MKGYSGYVTLPAGIDPSQQIESHMFFWFFEARKAPSKAPLALWLEGGPGSPTTHHALGENGPCIVQPDSETTVLNKWSWNNNVNMLYIDQPVQAGFSYDKVTPGVVDMLTGDVMTNGMFQNNFTYRTGNFASQEPAALTNTSMIAARAIYHFMELWFDEFEKYQRDSISIWSQSYGGHWAPAIADYFVKQQRANPDCEFSVGISTVGIINGLIDFLVQGPYFPIFAVNNTLGIKAYPQEVADSAMSNFTMPGGCSDQVKACHQLAAQGDPNNFANNATVLAACQSASLFCWNFVYAAYDVLSGVSVSLESFYRGRVC